MLEKRLNYANRDPHGRLIRGWKTCGSRRFVILDSHVRLVSETRQVTRFP